MSFYTNLFDIIPKAVDLGLQVFFSRVVFAPTFRSFPTISVDKRPVENRIGVLWGHSIGFGSRDPGNGKSRDFQLFQFPGIEPHSREFPGNFSFCLYSETNPVFMNYLRLNVV